MFFTVIYGSVRDNRQGIRAAHFLLSQLKKRGHDVDFFDAMELRLPLLNKMYKEYGEGKAPETLENLAGRIKKSDGFVIVSGEYNHSVPPGLSNLLDHFLEEWFWRPSAIVSYSAGSFGGVRASVHLRTMLAELGMPAIPTNFAVPKVSQAFSEAGEATDDAYHRRIERFLKELEWYAEAFKAQRNKGTPY